MAEFKTMVLNMGPQHPATHGVLRVLLRLNGESVIQAIPELGYLHRGYEKLAENTTFYEFIPHTDRLDYLSPFSNNFPSINSYTGLGRLSIKVCIFKFLGQISSWLNLKPI